jgi:hypothetical protein
VWYSFNGVVSGLFGLLVESYGTWLLLHRLVDASQDSDIPKTLGWRMHCGVEVTEWSTNKQHHINVPFTFVINNRKINLMAVETPCKLPTFCHRFILHLGPLDRE